MTGGDLRHKLEDAMSGEPLEGALSPTSPAMHTHSFLLVLFLSCRIGKFKGTEVLNS
jgi:hypothetical protein